MSAIDTHAHLFFDTLLGSVGDLGPFLTRDAAGIATLTTGGFDYVLGKIPGLDRTAEQRLEELDKAGIEVQVVSASPLWYFSHTPAEVASRFASRYNELLSEWTSADPARLKALALLPVSDVGAAVTELERAVRDLNVVGAVIGTDAAEDLDHPDLDDLYAACSDLDVPLFIHSVVPGIDGPDGDPRLRRWLRDVTIGYPFEETIATTSLLLGGVLRRHSELDICISHGGGAVPFLLGRVRAWVATGAAPVDLADFDEGYNRLWFDVHVHSDKSADLLIETANPERLVLGTNFGGWDSSSPGQVERLPIDMGANARRLLRL